MPESCHFVIVSKIHKIIIEHENKVKFNNSLRMAWITACLYIIDYVFDNDMDIMDVQNLCKELRQQLYKEVFKHHINRRYDLVEHAVLDSTIFDGSYINTQFLYKIVSKMSYTGIDKLMIKYHIHYNNIIENHYLMDCFMSKYAIYI